MKSMGILDGYTLGSVRALESDEVLSAIEESARAILGLVLSEL